MTSIHLGSIITSQHYSLEFFSTRHISWACIAYVVHFKFAVSFAVYLMNIHVPQDSWGIERLVYRKCTRPSSSSEGAGDARLNPATPIIRYHTH